MLLVTPRIAGVWVGVRVLTWPWVMVTRLLSLLVMQRPSSATLTSAILPTNKFKRTVVETLCNARVASPTPTAETRLHS